MRGNRRGLLQDALAPLNGKVGAQTFDKLAQSLSLIFGIEAIIVLKDIWGLDDDEVREARPLGSARSGRHGGRRSLPREIGNRRSKNQEERGGKPRKEEA